MSERGWATQQGEKHRKKVSTCCDAAVEAACVDIRAKAAELATLRTQLAAAQSDAAEVRKAASALVRALDTCHQCEGILLVDDGPTYCSEGGCSYDCEEHEGSECKRISVIHAELKALLTPASPKGAAPQASNTVNLNDYVWIRTTEKGREIARRKWDDILTVNYCRLAPEVCHEKGWVKIQLHELMWTFGQDCVVGCDIPFETTISLRQPLPEPPKGAEQAAQGEG